MVGPLSVVVLGNNTGLLVQKTYQELTDEKKTIIIVHYRGQFKQNNGIPYFILQFA